MNIHEYQAKQIFKEFGVPVPMGTMVETVEDAVSAAEKLGVLPLVVKAQIHAGGRGKGGGVKVAKSIDEVEKAASAILGMNLITHQTGPEGKLVTKILVEEGLDIARELYFSIVPDRASAQVVVMASTEGGVEIEEVAEKSPEKIIKTYIHPVAGLSGFNLRQLNFGLGLAGEQAKQMSKMVGNLYRLFWELDCSLVEINPLVVTGRGMVIALDAKVNFDESALWRHKGLMQFRDLSEEDPLELEASEHNLNYIKLDGNIGNMVNGAGLAMATMDIIKLAGAEPANFLDVGGGASAQMVENGFRIILGDENVKAILINIFGGILRCDILATGVVEAAKKVGVDVPVVIRMEGTNVEEGRKILAESGVDLIVATDVWDAAQKVAEAAGV